MPDDLKFEAAKDGTGSPSYYGKDEDYRIGARSHPRSLARRLIDVTRCVCLCVAWFRGELVAAHQDHWHSAGDGQHGRHWNHQGGLAGVTWRDLSGAVSVVLYMQQNFKTALLCAGHRPETHRFDVPKSTGKADCKSSQDLATKTMCCGYTFVRVVVAVALNMMWQTR